MLRLSHPKGRAGRYIMDDAGAMCSHLGAPAWRKGIKKRTFSNVIFYIQNFATLFLLEGIATKRPRGVYYTRMSVSHHWLTICVIYNTRRRGLAKLLISVEGHAKA